MNLLKIREREIKFENLQIHIKLVEISSISEILLILFDKIVSAK